MANLVRNFIKGRMNKSVDERLVPNGEYIHAMNVRVGSTEDSEVGVVEVTKGNEYLTTLKNPSNDEPLSINATCIGAYADSANETIYWFVHDPTHFNAGANNKCDLIVSYNTNTGVVRYHVVSCVNPNDTNRSTLNFDTNDLVNGVDLIDGLLFFTDNFNQPRVINVSRDYPLPDNNNNFFDDPLLEENIRVIKKPPFSPPQVELIKIQESVNFIDERFACFAYRYKYADGQYSATSPFSNPAFVAEPFDFSIESFLNEGMTNNFNAANITFNTGNSLVVGIDLLYKDASDSVIKVIKKYEKSEDGLADDAFETFRFDKDKIFTILPDSEILRLYDNVPLKAKAQTLMGNRLMYGNYVEGYNLKDSNGNPVDVSYTASFTSNPLSFTEATDSLASGLYTIDPSLQVGYNGSIVIFDFSSVQPSEVVSGARLEFTVNLRHKQFSGSFTPQQQTQDFELNFDYVIPQTLPGGIGSVFSSASFESAVGTLANIQPMSTACDGSTFTDFFNCAIPTQLAALSGTTSISLDKASSSITFNNFQNEPIAINPIQVQPPPTDGVALQFPAVRWNYNIPSGGNAFEYFEVVSASAVFVGAQGSKSLHSNRDYEFAVVYMDDYGRMSSPVVSEFNNIHVPCSRAQFINKAKIEIPPQQLPPSWATRYKFVARENKENYEVIYSNIYFTDEESGYGYILLDGENSAKVEKGDRLIIKSDGSGPSSECRYVTILDKEVKEEDFLGGGGVEPGGVYAKVRPNTLELSYRQDSVVNLGASKNSVSSGSNGPVLTYRVNQPDPTSPGNFVPMDIPAGSRVNIKIGSIRHSTGILNSCAYKEYRFEDTITATRNYSSFYDFFIGENLDKEVVKQKYVVLGGLNPKYYTPNDNSWNVPTSGPSKIDIHFKGNGNQFLEIAGPENCGSNSSQVSIHIQVFKTERTLILETLPSDTNPDIFYENENVFEIENGFHKGSTQDQTATQSAICFPEFFNCYSFGNGAESSKIRDSVTGKTFGLGNRALAVKSEDDRRINRFADITYSGIYNDESNINKLNEFNLGLLNFKNLEESYGIITVLDGMETDVFVLQEDKISYVLAGKNLLSDAAAGGALASVPEVLGTQIARTEDYGNSNNPESYVRWGDKRFFTDAKRGAVIQLKGQGRSEALTVLSEFGMRSWFRNLFIESFDKQKLGGFDPYMNEFVLSSTDITNPQDASGLLCGVVQQNIVINDSNPNYSFDVSFPSGFGDVSVEYSISSVSGTPVYGTIIISDGTDISQGEVDNTGSFQFSLEGRTTSSTSANVSIRQKDAGDSFTIDTILVNCPSPSTMSVIEVVLTNNEDVGKEIHVQYNYSNQGQTYPRKSDLVTFGSIFTGTPPLVSRYDTISGVQGTPLIPSNGGSVTAYTNKLGSDTFDVDNTKHKVGYFFSNTLYPNTASGVASIISNSSFDFLQGTGSQRSRASFNVPSTNNDYLYIVWDFRSSSEIDLCGPHSSIAEACCDNTCFCIEQCSSYTFTVISGPLTVEYTDCSTGQLYIGTVTSGSDRICSRTKPVVVSGDGDISGFTCGQCI